MRSTVRAAGLILGATLMCSPALGQYVAETGRSQTANMAPAALDANGTSTTTVFQLDPKELWSADVAKALTESQVDRLAVQSEGVNTSLRTWAEIQLNAIHGRSTLKLTDGTRVPALFAALSMVYQNQLWVRAPILPVESPELARRFGLNDKQHQYVSGTFVMKNPQIRTWVMASMSNNAAPLVGWSESEKKALKKFGWRLMSFLNLPGEFRLVPLAGSSELWLAPQHLQRPELLNNDELAQKVAALDKAQPAYAVIGALDAALRRSFVDQKPDTLAASVAAARDVLATTPGYWPSNLLQMDYWKSVVRPYQKASWIFLVSFVLFGVYLFGTRKGRGIEANRPQTEAAPSTLELSPATGGAMAMLAVGGGASLSVSPAVLYRAGGQGSASLADHLDEGVGSRKLWWAGYLTLCLAAFTLLAALVTRFALGGRMPVSNMFEAVTFALSAFAVVAVGVEGVYRRGWIGALSAFVGWSLMLAANSMPMHQRKVEPLVAVLNSIWLNYHVTSLLVSYSCFLLAFICSATYLFMDITGRQPRFLPGKDAVEYVSYRVTQIGWPLLTLGIFLGAVWANTAWGSYWSWDPKETWALITWFSYTIYLHLRMISGWTDRRAAWANVLGFVMVLITFFGVSYLPGLAGGMHTYAEPISR